MALDLEELRSKVSNQTLLPGDDDEEFTDDDTEESEFVYDDSDFATAMALLKDAMNVMGFLGDRKVSGHVVLYDRKRMIRLADEIKEFMDLIDEQTAEGVEE